MKLSFPIRRRRAHYPVTRFSVERLAFVLDRIEDTYAEATGERLSSAEFYERYERGEADSVFAAAWATYYEAYRRQAHTANDETRIALQAFPPLVPALLTA